MKIVIMCMDKCCREFTEILHSKLSHYKHKINEGYTLDDFVITLLPINKPNSVDSSFYFSKGITLFINDNSTVTNKEAYSISCFIRNYLENKSYLSEQINEKIQQYLQYYGTEDSNLLYTFNRNEIYEILCNFISWVIENEFSKRSEV